MMERKTRDSLNTKIVLERGEICIRSSIHCLEIPLIVTRASIFNPEGLLKLYRTFNEISESYFRDISKTIVPCAIRLTEI